jgi:hypothetical protein
MNLVAQPALAGRVRPREPTSTARTGENQIRLPAGVPVGDASTMKPASNPGRLTKNISKFLIHVNHGVMACEISI